MDIAWQYDKGEFIFKKHGNPLKENKTEIPYPVIISRNGEVQGVNGLVSAGDIRLWGNSILPFSDMHRLESTVSISGEINQTFDGNKLTDYK